ncbi:Abnormal spindle-like microcephaly-associated [Portunus trituberculatus]|uniref:Abnormal spindle-like microcephaly-associated n=1 Tax=Portunus trituberculatus TaxID=210409 RepID=A0A5B7E9B8_PORTR|nr:Abnormal spindle-like microcephaly-associated [Portunus trituberculatus]
MKMNQGINFFFHPVQGQGFTVWTECRCCCDRQTPSIPFQMSGSLLPSLPICVPACWTSCGDQGCQGAAGGMEEAPGSVPPGGAAGLDCRPCGGAAVVEAAAAWVTAGRIQPGCCGAAELLAVPMFHPPAGPGEAVACGAEAAPGSSNSTADVACMNAAQHLLHTRRAVLTMQAYTRGWRCRQRLAVMVKTAAVVKRQLGRAVMAQSRKSQQAVVVVQLCIKIWLTRRRFLQHRKAVVVLQAAFRAHQQRREYLRLKKASLLLQRCGREKLQQ